MKKLLIGAIAILIIAGVYGVSTTATHAADCALNKGFPYKTAYSKTVYLVSENCTKTAINPEKKYFSYFESWDSVATVSQDALNQVPNDSLGFLPWGTLLKPKNGDVEKIAKNGLNTVHVRVDNDWYRIESEDVFTKYGFQWSWIRDITASGSAFYRYGNPRAPSKRYVSSTWVPVGIVVKVEGSPKLYVLENQNGNKVWRYLNNLSEFYALNYREDRILTVSQLVWSELMEAGVSELFCIRGRGQDEGIWFPKSIAWSEDTLPGGYTETIKSADGVHCP